MKTKEFGKRVKDTTFVLVGRFWSSETAVMSLLAILVGLGAGLGTVIFVRMIEFFSNVFFGGGKLLGLPGESDVILLPALGSTLG